MKFDQGWIENKDGQRLPITVKSKKMVGLPSYLIGTALIGTGLTIITRSAFKKGAQAYEDGQFDTMVKLGVIEKSKD